MAGPPGERVRDPLHEEQIRRSGKDEATGLPVRCRVHLPFDTEDQLRLVLDLVDRHAGRKREQIDRRLDRQLPDLQRVKGDVAVVSEGRQGSN